jgi:hypothetical protein
MQALARLEQAWLLPWGVHLVGLLLAPLLYHLLATYQTDLQLALLSLNKMLLLVSFPFQVLTPFEQRLSEFVPSLVSACARLLPALRFLTLSPLLLLQGGLLLLEAAFLHIYLLSELSLFLCSRLFHLIRVSASSARLTNICNVTAPLPPRGLLWDARMAYMILLLLAGSYLRCLLAGCLWFGFWTALHRILYASVWPFFAYLKHTLALSSLLRLIPH